MSSKLGRNDRCWCGSGKKYKRCHFVREAEQPITQMEAVQRFQTAFSHNLCLVPLEMKNSCSGQIAKAHTVSRGASLSKIARSGHVYGLSMDLDSPDKADGLTTHKLKGINQASTFTGFCTFHDGNIFKLIDRGEFHGSDEQCFLLAYRTASRELYTKIAASELLSSSGDLDSGRDISEQLRIQRFLSELKTGTFLGLKDIESQKSGFDKMLTERDFSPLRYYIVNLQSPPGIMGASGFFPTHDFSGHQVQDIANPNRVSDAIFFSSIASGKHGAVVFPGTRTAITHASLLY